MRRSTAWALVAGLVGLRGAAPRPPPPMTPDQEQAAEEEMKQIADQEARDQKAEEQNRPKPGEPDPDADVTIRVAVRPTAGRGDAEGAPATRRPSSRTAPARCGWSVRPVPPTDTPTSPARHAAVCATNAGSFRFPRTGTGARYGLSVSTSSLSGGTSFATSRRSAAVLYVSIPANDRCRPTSRHARAVSASPVNECITPRTGPWRSNSARSTRTTSGPASRQWITTGLPSRRARSRCRAKYSSWRCERGLVPVAVQPGLADGDGERVGRQPGHLVEVARAGLGDVVGLDADHGREPVGIPGGQGQRGPAGGEVDADGQHPGHAGGRRPLQHGRQVVGEPRVVQVRVGVDQFGRHRGSP